MQQEERPLTSSSTLLTSSSWMSVVAIQAKKVVEQQGERKFVSHVTGPKKVLPQTAIILRFQDSWLMRFLAPVGAGTFSDCSSHIKEKICHVSFLTGQWETLVPAIAVGPHECQNRVSKQFLAGSTFFQTMSAWPAGAFCVCSLIVQYCCCLNSTNIPTYVHPLPLHPDTCTSPLLC